MRPFQRVTYDSQIGSQMNSWPSNQAYFVCTSFPWFHLGNWYFGGSEAGVFAFSHDPESGYNTDSFQIVLTSKL